MKNECYNDLRKAEDQISTILSEIVTKHKILWISLDSQVVEVTDSESNGSEYRLPRVIISAAQEDGD